MGLKYQLDTLEGVDESLAALYTEQDGKFVLGVEGLPEQEDVSGLKSKVDELLNEKKEAKRKADEAAEQARIAKEEAARKSGDTEALEKSWSEKLTKREAELMKEIESRDSVITSKFVDAEAVAIASELAVDGSADVLLPHVKNRISVERTESGEYRTVIRDAQGKASALTLAELKEEIRNNKSFAPVIKGNPATGGGATGGKPNGGGASQIKTTSDRIAARKAARANS